MAAPGDMVEYPGAVGLELGSSMTVLCKDAGRVTSCMILCSVAEEGSPRISLCRASPVSFPSVSESPPSSNVSANVRSASEATGSSERICRDDGDDARDRKDGGGEAGIDVDVRSFGREGEISS